MSDRDVYERAVREYAVEKSAAIRGAVAPISCPEEFEGVMQACVITAASTFMEIRGVPKTTDSLRALANLVIRAMDRWADKESN